MEARIATRELRTKCIGRLLSPEFSPAATNYTREGTKLDEWRLTDSWLRFKPPSRSRRNHEGMTRVNDWEDLE